MPIEDLEHQTRWLLPETLDYIVRGYTWSIKFHKDSTLVTLEVEQDNDCNG